MSTHSQSLSTTMDVQLQSEFYQQAFHLFVEGCSNVDIHKISNKFTPKTIAKILQTEIDLVLDEMETTVAARHPFIKNHNYEKRRNRIIRQLSDERRLIFSGPKANSLGENTVHHFLNVCKHYLRESNLKSYPFKNLYKIFRKWLLPGRDHSKETEQSDLSELQKKKREMEVVKIEHQILLKKSKMLELQADIELLKENLKKKGEKAKKEETSESDELSDSKHEPKTNHTYSPRPLKPILKEEEPKSKRERQTNGEILANNKIKKQMIENSFHRFKKDGINSHSSKRKDLKQTKEDSRSEVSQQLMGRENDGGLRWRQEELQFFVKLLEMYSIRDQTSLSSEMIKKFGNKDRFSDHNIRDKKFEMFRQCRHRFLVAVEARRLLKQKAYLQLVEHFETLDNRRSYEFQSEFMSKYYLCKMEQLSDKTMREVIDTVLQLHTRILTPKYMKKKKMEKDMINANLVQQEQPVPDRKSTANVKVEQYKQSNDEKVSGLDEGQSSLQAKPLNPGKAGECSRTFRQLA